MGLRIDLHTTPVAPRSEAGSPPSRTRKFDVGREEAPPPPLPKAGFGAGTASQATAAYVTLGRGLYSARQIVPTPEEVQAELRAKLTEMREQREARDEERKGRGLESRIPEASPKAVAFAQEAGRSRLERSEEQTESKTARVQSDARSGESLREGEVVRSTDGTGGRLDLAG